MIFRRRRLPAELRPPLNPDERVVGWAGTDTGGVVVASTAGLFLPGADRRLGWHEIHQAGWSGRALTVTAGEPVAQREGYAVTADRPPVTVHLPDPGDLPQVVRTRVTRSVSFTSHHRVPGGGVRVVARRVPGTDGLTWAVRYDPGTDPDRPEVREATDALVAGHRAAQDPAG
ncbi:MAG: hypothetical protein GEV12_00860 [Micromonosporaceae bacterium]|nr:hypothetical protein [Micromonosporaceae bacterium]